LLDKSAFCGGNSTKATSGINGSQTSTQRAQGVKDTNELFTQDTMSGGAKKPEIVKVLCHQSGPAVEWLIEKFGLDLSLLARLGGHSQPRTHRGKERFPGMTITYALIQMAEKIAEKHPDKCRIITKARVTKLITDDKGNCVGVEYEKDGVKLQEHGPVILATGGFGADFTSDSLLGKYRPDLMHLPTTNGEHCTGDGIKMGEAIGAKTIDLEWVQVHPTGLVKPDDPDAKVKFLAAEALRGVGGIVVDRNGQRFANELGRRDYFTGEMWKNKAPFRLLLNSKSSKEIHWHCEHYKGRGIMKQFQSGADIAADMKIPVATLADTFKNYNEIAQKQISNPDGGPYDAYPNGKTWDKFGKKFYHNVPLEMNDTYHVAIVTPVIHYCMGGLEITTDSEVIGAGNKPIKGLYAAGEIAGGVHGNNRLGGNSLLDCVVFGIVAGKHCASYMLGSDRKDVALSSLAGPLVVAKEEVAAAPVSAAAPKSFTLADVAKHNTKGDCWVAINGQVLDVTKFLKDHPGGELAILTFAGRDASAEFNMIHPKGVIPKYAPWAVIGSLSTGASPVVAAKAAPVAAVAAPAGTGKAYTLEEVSKHNSKTDCWVVLHNQVLNVTSFLKDHPGGELAILTFAGKDATKEFDMIHPPNVVQKYAPHAIIGHIGSAAAGAPVAAPAAAGGAAAPLLANPNVGISGEHWWGEARNTRGEYGVWGPSIGSIFCTIYHLIVLFAVEVLSTIVCVKNWTVPHDKSGLTRSAVFLIVFSLIHSLGNLHVYAGPNAFNGYAYFLNRPVPWDTLFLPVELYLLAAGILHVTVATIRTVKFKKLAMLADANGRAQLSMAITGAILFVFLFIHIFTFRLVSVYPEYTFRTKWMYPFYCANDELDCSIASTKDLYKMEFQLFQQSFLTVLFYLFCVVVFALHMSEGFVKIVNSSQYIPRNHKGNARILGICFCYFIALLYFSYPVYCYFFPVEDWKEYDREHIEYWKDLVKPH